MENWTKQELTQRAEIKKSIREWEITLKDAPTEETKAIAKNRIEELKRCLEM